MKKGVIMGIAIAIIIILSVIYVLTKTERVATPIPYGNDGLTTNNTSTNISINSTQTTPQTINLVIEGYAFNPAVINIKVGDTVIWTNRDSARHTVTSDSGDELASPLFGKGESYSNKFEVVGTYPYYCIPHPSMKGTVIVNP